MDAFSRVSSTSGDKLFYLSRGLYASCSWYKGKPYYHIRRHYCTKSGESNAERFDPHRETVVRPSKDGVCLDNLGWWRLMESRVDLEIEYDALLEFNKDMAMEVGGDSDGGAEIAAGESKVRKPAAHVQPRPMQGSSSSEATPSASMTSARVNGHVGKRTVKMPEPAESGSEACGPVGAKHRRLAAEKSTSLEGLSDSNPIVIDLAEPSTLKGTSVENSIVID